MKSARGLPATTGPGAAVTHAACDFFHGLVAHHSAPAHCRLIHLLKATQSTHPAMASAVSAAAAAAGAKAAARSASIVWFKATDLRIRDHEPLFTAHKETDGPVINCFIFDPFWFGKTAHGFAKTGHYRARFLLESVADLRKVRDCLKQEGGCVELGCL